MRIPDGPTGVPTVSSSQLRTYGAAGFRLIDQEKERGCPRLYRKKYVERAVPETWSFPLRYGQTVHAALHRMENEGCGPEEALEAVWPVDLDPASYAEALQDLRKYLERGASPVDRYGTLATEIELDAPLCVLPDGTPVAFRGIIDWIGVDMDEPNVIHVVDYKTNRYPPNEDAVRGDVQLKAYAWLVLQNAEQWLPDGVRPRVVVHLDAIKWRDIEVSYPSEEIAAWHDWATAVVHRIWEDEEGLPVVNDGCDWCPIKLSCPAFSALTDDGETLMKKEPGQESEDDRQLLWRDDANRIRLLLEKGVKEIDERFQSRTMAAGRVETKRWLFSVETEWATRIDPREMHELLGDEFYDVVSVGKGRVEAKVHDWPPHEAAAVMEAMRSVPVGTKVKKTKRGD